MVPDIIPLTEYNNDRPPKGDTVSDDDSSVDSSLGHPPTESKGCFVSGGADDGPSNYPSTAYKITSLSQRLPPNTSQEGDISQEGAKADPKRKYKRKQWPGAVWEQGNYGKMKHVGLNKWNSQLYALTFGTQTIPPMNQKISKKMIRLNNKKYKCSIRENGDMSL